MFDWREKIEETKDLELPRLHFENLDFEKTNYFKNFESNRKSILKKEIP